MTHRIIITGTDTGIGKTVFAAGLTQLLDGYYFKPIQSGLEPETDRDTVLKLSGLSPDRILPDAYRLSTPASPHLSAERDGIQINAQSLELPQTDRPLIIEGAGGLMVPLTRDLLFIDLFARWNAPVVLCARTTLGTLNHTLLSLEALKRRNIPVLGIALIGAAHEDNQRTLSEMGRTTILGRLPRLNPLNSHSLRTAFMQAFSKHAFQSTRDIHSIVSG